MVVVQCLCTQPVSHKKRHWSSTKSVNEWLLSDAESLDPAGRDWKEKGSLGGADSWSKGRWFDSQLGGYQVLFYIAHTLVRGRLFRTTTTSLNFYWMAAATRCAHACICQRDGISLHQVVCSRSTTANEAQNNSNIHHSLVDCCPIDAVLIQQSLQFVDPCPQLPIFLK